MKSAGRSRILAAVRDPRLGSPLVDIGFDEVIIDVHPLDWIRMHATDVRLAAASQAGSDPR